MQITDTQNFRIQFDDTMFASSELAGVKGRVQFMAVACETDLGKLCDLFKVNAAQFFGPQNRTVVTLVKNLSGAVNSGFSTHGSQMSVDVDAGRSNENVMYLFVCEMAEILMNVIGGWNPGDSAGEALSRLCGARLHPTQPAQSIADVNLWLFFDPTKDPSAPVADSAFHKDWVTSSFTGGPDKNGKSVAGDQDGYSIGAGLVFLNYLTSQLDFDIHDVIAAMPQAIKTGSATLGNASKSLTHADLPAFGPYHIVIDSHFTEGNANLNTNNPFPVSLTGLAPAAAGNSTGIFTFITMNKGDVVFNLGRPGEAFQGWEGLTMPVVKGSTIGATQEAPACGVLGEAIHLFIRNRDGSISWTKTTDGSAFSPWASVPGGVTGTGALAAAGRPGNLFLFNRNPDGRILFDQISPAGTFVGWQEVPGGLHTNVAPAAGMRDQTLFVFALGTDGKAHFNQASPGSAFVGWEVMTGAPATNLPLSCAGRAGNLFVFLIGTDGQIHFNQAAPGSAFVGWQVMPGSRKTSLPVGVGMQNGRLFVFSTMADGRIVFNQADPGSAFVGWQLQR